MNKNLSKQINKESSRLRGLLKTRNLDSSVAISIKTLLDQLQNKRLKAGLIKGTMEYFDLKMSKSRELVIETSLTENNEKTK